LSRDRATRRVVKVVQNARVLELERATAELRTELEQAGLKIVETKACENSLRSSYTRLEDECEILHDAAEALKWEKAEAETARKTEVAAVCTKFQEYCVHHRKKLRDLRFHLEKAVNEFGAGCLPYTGKKNTIGSIIGWTIGSIIGWFDSEIKSLPATIAKANKTFLCYAVVGILLMLYHNGCDHIEGLQTIMASCDASIL
jgi:hypothetical protein